MQPVQPCGLPPTPAPPGKRLSCIQRLLDGGAAAASPVPGRANLGLVEQCYKYLPLRDPVTQPRSRKGKRCPPAALRASVPAKHSPESPHVLVHGQGTGVQSPEVAGTAVGRSCGKAQATFLPPGQSGKCQLHASPICPQPSFTSTTPLSPPRAVPQKPRMRPPRPHIHPFLPHSRHSAPPAAPLYH